MAHILRTTTLVLLTVTAAVPSSLLAAGTVGSGTPASCTEAAFDTALGGGGTVSFSCGGSAHTITLSARKTIAADTVIDGANLITLSGGNASALFEVNSGVTFDLRHITLADGRTTGNGDGGAAIRSNGGIVIILDGDIVNNSTADAGCGAIALLGGSLTATNTTFRGNHVDGAAQGGVMCVNNVASVTLENCTISGNYGSASGVMTMSGLMTMTNCTVANNTSDVSSSGNFALNVFGDDAVLTLRNTIIANNPSGNCGTFVDGTIVDGGNNLQYPATECGATIASLNPHLQPLGNYGGTTLTHALGWPSPAVDGGDSGTCLPADQRGHARVDGDNDGTVVCDIGAYEADAGSESVPATSTAGLVALALLLALGGGALLLRRG